MVDQGAAMGEVVVNLHEAKSRLSAFVERAAAGEEIIITRADPHPKARLVPFEPTRRLREPGGSEGKVWVADDFDEPLRHGHPQAFTGEE